MNNFLTSVYFLSAFLEAEDFLRVCLNPGRPSLPTTTNKKIRQEKLKERKREDKWQLKERITNRETTEPESNSCPLWREKTFPGATRTSILSNKLRPVAFSLFPLLLNKIRGLLHHRSEEHLRIQTPFHTVSFTDAAQSNKQASFHCDMILEQCQST
jgi:hypothetical protein